MDFITHFPPSNSKIVVLVVVDCLFQAHFSPLPSHFSAIQIAEVFLCDIIRLHGIPTSLVFDHVIMTPLRQPILARVISIARYTPLNEQCLSSANGWLNRNCNCYLEDYLCCFTGDHPRTWQKLLPWVEWHYNIAWHSFIHMSPYEAVYGRPPPNLLDFMTDLNTVNNLLIERTHALKRTSVSSDKGWKPHRC